MSLLCICLLDGIKKRSAEDKFTCPNCREENSGAFPVCRLTEYLKGESIQGDDKDQKSGKMLIFLGVSIALETEHTYNY